MTPLHYAIIAGTFAFIGGMVWIAVRGRAGQVDDQTDLGTGAEADPRIRFRSQFWGDNNTN